MWVVFGLMFGGITALALVGLFSPRFQDNMLQCAGMALLAVWSADQAAQIFAMRYVGPMQGIIAAGLLLYGLGVAAKVYHYRKEKLDARASSIRRHVRS